jgi:hypothetical protein
MGEPQTLLPGPRGSFRSKTKGPDEGPLYLTCWLDLLEDPDAGHKIGGISEQRCRYPNMLLVL